LQKLQLDILSTKKLASKLRKSNVLLDQNISIKKINNVNDEIDEINITSSNIRNEKTLNLTEMTTTIRLQLSIEKNLKNGNKIIEKQKLIVVNRSNLNFENLIKFAKSKCNCSNKYNNLK
jgi:hypothetical protein